jgi:superfamily II DNA or RNA helicase/SOS-response transcriptional repressor LexA
MDINKALSEGIKTGFIDHRIHSLKVYQPELLTNDHKQGKKFLTTILRELERCEEFWFSVAFVTTSGIATLINTLIELEKDQVNGKILASQYLNFTQPEALKRIRQFSNIELRISTEGSFHSKGYLFKNENIYDLIIGSSNLTQTALCSNKEWNLKVSATQESELINQAVNEFTNEFELAQEVTDEYLAEYEEVWRARTTATKKFNEKVKVTRKSQIQPNQMQREALDNIEDLRLQGKNKALLISATGTGKTYLSAFDVQKCKPKKFLFVVHRLTIAEKAMATFKELLGDNIKMGIYSGVHRDIEADYLFSTVQTISKLDHLNKFAHQHFDYIVIDETHRAGAESYKKIMDYFKPDFLLGMTATPERTDGADIFELFDHNIAYEIRLHRALEEGMLSPFHYYGVTDLTINEEEIDTLAKFNQLKAQERVDRIIEKVELFGCDDGEVRGLVFCADNKDSLQLSLEFNRRGYKTIALTGNNDENDRQQAIRRLESEIETDKLDYIFTVDIFNEGIDIPKVNQIIMLRPTQSAIVFVQQLGRGLRLEHSKEYLTVIDFIGNYDNNYLVPIALYGDTSYNKDRLRRFVSSGSRLIPGSSTINFDTITKERIFASIDSANMKLLSDLKKDYVLLKYKLGRTPMMMDFIEHGSRDPFLYIEHSKSFLNFVCKVEKNFTHPLSEISVKLLEFFSNEINNAKRVEESLILKELVQNGSCTVLHLKKLVSDRYDYQVSDQTIMSCLNNLNFGFPREKSGGKLLTLNQIYGLDLVILKDGVFNITTRFKVLLEQSVFEKNLQDSINYSIYKFNEIYNRETWRDGFSLYQKYSRKDVFRILNVEINPVAQNVGGYLVSPDNTHCPIFVNYHKDEDISESTKYEDEFINNKEFIWMSKSNRKLESNDVQSILGKKGDIRLPLFIKKTNDEGIEFYFMGDVEPIPDRTEQTLMNNGKPVVRIIFDLSSTVPDEIYEYLREKGIVDAETKKVPEKQELSVINLFESEEEKNLIPFYEFYAAAGSFSDMQENNNYELLAISGNYQKDDGYFACRVSGESMNKVIDNGALCLFKIYSGGSRNGKIVLVESFGKVDDDYNSAFTIKTYASQKVAVDGGSWEHSSIILTPNSYDPEYKDIVLNEDDCDGMRVVGEFVTVLDSKLIGSD